jgi:ABC-type multidrug transport system fused ATPase/permease subunit
VLVLGGSGLQLTQPQIVRYFIDAAIAGASPRRLIGAALAFLAVTVSYQLVSVATTYVTERVAWTATNALRADLALHCLRLDLSFHKAHTPGEMIERIDGDVAALANFFSLFVVRIGANLVLLAGVLAVLFWEDWRIGLGFSASALGTLALLVSMRELALPHWEATRQTSAELFGFLEERLAGTEDIRANGATPYVMQGFHRLMRQRLDRERRAAAVNSVVFGGRQAMAAMSLLVALALGVYLYGAGAISIGTIYLLVHYNSLIHGPLEQIMVQIQDLQRAGASVHRIQSLLRTESRIRDGVGATLPAGALSVEFRDVSFGYVADDLVLRDLSFRLVPGRVLGLLGRTGSGKTTLIRLLARLYDVDAGQVLLGDVDVRATSLAELRRRVGVVTQDVQLFHGTVRDNLTFFDPTIADARLLEVIEQLGLRSWYRSLSNGLDTGLGAGGGGLSAGEAQLLAFIRVFLKDPGLVILDEASSRLDPTTERLIETAIAKLLEGRTGIVIAHRLATVQRVDEIMILEDGVIRERGERERLAGDPTSHFHQLLQVGLEEALA